MGASGLLGACDPTLPDSPLFSGIVEVRDVTTSGPLAFVANDVSSVLGAPPGTVDESTLHDLIVIANLADGPASVGFYDAPTTPKRLFARRIVVDGARNLGYFALGAGPGEGWVQILDLTIPNSPVPLFLIPLPQVVSGIGASGNLLAVSSPDGLRLFDVSDPSAPAARATFTPAQNAGLAQPVVVGDRIYLAATRESGGFLEPRLLVLDVANPLLPAQLGEATIASTFNGVGLALKIRDNRAYLMADIGLYVLDLATLPTPALLGIVPRSSLALSALFTDLEMVGKAALLATQGEGLRAVDLADPALPSQLVVYAGTQAPGSVARAVAVGAGEAFVALSKTGVRVLPVDSDEDDVLGVEDVCPDVADPLQSDVDNDLVGDACDVCTLEPDFDQTDADGDGYGNRCDPDLDNDGVVNFADLALFKQAFLTADPVADLNVDGVVNFADLALFKKRFLQSPGPSASEL